MTESEAHKILSGSSSLNLGKFYGKTNDLGLGAGMFFSDIRCPVFDPDDRIFSTIEMSVYVLTHECDVDPGNDRSFNDYLTICPLIPLGVFLDEYATWGHSDDELRSFLSAIANRSVNRLIYLPPGPPQMEYGALMYLNNLASTHVGEFELVVPIASVSAYGLDVIDKAFSNHFLRPKADKLSFSQQ
jgi:hypothetical protein